MHVPAPSGRSAAVIAAGLITVLVVVAAPADVSAATPRNLARFKAAVGSVESGGRYDARNTRTGAYGKYQILPSNWPAWARSYLGSSTARPTPRNQERVASGKMTSLYRWLGSWRRVAYWWLTGSTRRSGWSRTSTRYVERVMAKFRRSGSGAPSRVRLIGDRVGLDRLRRSLADRPARRLPRRHRPLLDGPRSKRDADLHRTRRDLVRTDGSDPRQGQDLRRRQARPDRRPATVDIPCARGRVHEALVDRSQTHATHRRRRDVRSVDGRHRRVRDREVAGRRLARRDHLDLDPDSRRPAP